MGTTVSSVLPRILHFWMCHLKLVQVGNHLEKGIYSFVKRSDNKGPLCESFTKARNVGFDDPAAVGLPALVFHVPTT